MNNKNKLIAALSDKSSFKRFGVLEDYAIIADSEDDIDRMLRIAEYDPDPIVRHEAIAELVHLEIKKPSLTTRFRYKIQEYLIRRIHHDKSVVVRHEAIEALAYFGDEKSVIVLQNFLKGLNSDIRCSAQISYNLLVFRLKCQEPSE